MNDGSGRYFFLPLRYIKLKLASGNIAHLIKPEGEQLTQIECNCRDKDGVYPNGAYCRIITGDDTYIDGECRSGKCEGL